MLDYLASGMTEKQILSDFPELTSEDIRACLAFAADRERQMRISGGPTAPRLTAPIIDAVKVRVVIEYDPEAKAFAAYCPELPGCASAGDTEEEAFRNIREAIELYLEPTGEVGKDGKVVEVVV